LPSSSQKPAVLGSPFASSSLQYVDSNLTGLLRLPLLTLLLTLLLKLLLCVQAL